MRTAVSWRNSSVSMKAISLTSVIKPLCYRCTVFGLASFCLYKKCGMKRDISALRCMLVVLMGCDVHSELMLGNKQYCARHYNSRKDQNCLCTVLFILAFH